MQGFTLLHKEGLWMKFTLKRLYTWLGRVDAPHADGGEVGELRKARASHILVVE